MAERGTLGCLNDRQGCRRDSRTVGGKEWGQACYVWGWGRENIWEIANFEPPAVRRGMECPIQSCPSSPGWLPSVSPQPQSPCTDSPRTAEASSVSCGGWGRALFLSMSSLSCIHGSTIVSPSASLCLCSWKGSVCVCPRGQGPCGF